MPDDSLLDGEMYGAGKHRQGPAGPATVSRTSTIRAAGCWWRVDTRDCCRVEGGFRGPEVRGTPEVVCVKLAGARQPILGQGRARVCVKLAGAMQPILGWKQRDLRLLFVATP